MDSIKQGAIQITDLNAGSYGIQGNTSTGNMVTGPSSLTADIEDTLRIQSFTPDRTPEQLQKSIKEIEKNMFVCSNTIEQMQHEHDKNVKTERTCSKILHIITGLGIATAIVSGMAGVAENIVAGIVTVPMFSVIGFCYAKLEDHMLNKKFNKEMGALRAQKKNLEEERERMKKELDTIKITSLVNMAKAVKPDDGKRSSMIAEEDHIVIISGVKLPRYTHIPGAFHS